MRIDNTEIEMLRQRLQSRVIIRPGGEQIRGMRPVRGSVLTDSTQQGSGGRPSGESPNRQRWESD